MEGGLGEPFFAEVARGARGGGTSGRARRKSGFFPFFHDGLAE